MRYVVFIVIIMCCSPAYAEEASSDNIPLFGLPQGVQHLVGSEERRCYSIEEYKVVVGIAKDKLDLEYGRGLLEKKLELSLEQVGLYKERAITFQVEMDLWKGEYDRLYKKWEEDNLRMHRSEESGVDTTFWMVLGGEVTVVVVAIAVIFVSAN